MLLEIMVCPASRSRDSRLAIGGIAEESRFVPRLLDAGYDQSSVSVYGQAVVQQYIRLLTEC